MDNRFIRRPLTTALLTLGLSLGLPAVSLADNPAVTLSLPAQPLDRAVLELADQAGLTIGGDASLLRGKQAPALNGEYTPEQALSQLLEGSGVGYRYTGENQVSLMAAPEGDSATALPPVKIGASAIAGAQTTVAYDYEEIQASQPQDLKDLFRKEPSVAVGGSMAINQKVYVRGVEETAMLVKVDGGRQNNKVFHHNATNLIDPALLKAVRASAGVAPADDGPGAIGGSLIYETVDVADLLDSDRDFGGFVNGRYGSNGDHTTTAGSLYGRSNGFEFLGYLNHVDGDDYEDGEGDTVRFTGPALLSGLAKIAYENQQAGRFELTHERVNDDAARPYRANFGGLTAGRPVPESRIYDLSRENTVFNYSRETGGGLWNPSLTVANNETELETREVPLSDPSATIVYTGITESTSAVVKNTFHTAFAEIAAGVDYYDDSAIFKFAGDPDLEEQAENVGAFVQFRQPVGDNVDLSYGLRYDQQDFTGTDGSDQDDSGLSANLFGEVRLNDHVSLNAGYADVWGGIALAENYILNGAWNYASIAPVEANNYSVGIKLNGNGFVAEANSFRTKIDNGRVASWGGGPNLVSDFDIEGFDVLVGYFARRGNVSLKYANIESEKDGVIASSYDGNYFTIPLGELFTVTGALHFPEQRLELGLNAEIALDNNDVETSGASQKGYTVIGAYADYAILDSLSLRFEIDNLTDEAYTDRATYGQEFPTVKTLLEPGRSFVVSARYTF
ncbi:MAG: TonB-dependent receptor [Porticoccaceae bacterium]|nr:TonB-dependent receptor [Porticoccaceae bacterium]